MGSFSSSRKNIAVTSVDQKNTMVDKKMAPDSSSPPEASKEVPPSAYALPTIPATLDEVDAEFVTAALKHNGRIQDNAKVVSFEKIKFGREKGYLGDKCLLKKIVYDTPAPDAPNSIFVKLFPTDLVVPLAPTVSMWHVEVKFMKKTLKQLPDADMFQVPQIYFAECEPATEEGKPPHFAILMEPFTGQPHDIFAGMPYQHALRAAKDLAILHAPYWGWSHERYRAETDADGSKKFDGLTHIEDPGSQQGFAGMFKMGSALGASIFGEGTTLSKEQLENDFPGYVELWDFFGTEIWPLLQTRWKAVFQRWTIMPMALTHADFHVENMLLLEDGSNVYIDFQSAKLSPGVRDVAWMCTSSLTSEDRQNYERAIVKTYHESIVARGVEGYDLDQCWHDFVFMKIHGLFAGMLGGGIFANKNFQEKSGIFAAEPSEDALLERKRNNVLFSRIVDDMKHSEWATMLQALPEDA